MRFHLILYCLLISQLLAGQSKLPDFGQFTPEEIDLKKCAFDSSAEAVVLFDDASSVPGDGQYQMVTHRRTRIKILDKREVDRGNISLRFYSKEKYQYIDHIRGVVFNPGAESPTTYLDTVSIYTEKIDDYYSRIRFALPNVSEGSIIEYEYDIHSKNYGALDDWVFQHEIPTIKSSYFVEVILFAEFQFSVQTKPEYPIVVKRPEKSSVYFEMNNLPGLRFEPFMDAVKDYLQRVEFKLTGVNTGFGKTTVSKTWKHLAVELINDNDFGGATKKNLPGTGEIRALVAMLETDSARITEVYNYVRKNFAWNGYYSLYASDLKNVWEKRKGTATDINFVLINLLRELKLDAAPMLVAERDFGKIDVNFPFLDRFNKVVAYATAGEKVFIMDATQKFCPAHLPPFSLLNTIGFIVDGRHSKLVQILNKGNAYQNKISVDAALDEKGRLNGTATITSTGYAKQLRSEMIKTNPKKFINESLLTTGSGLEIDDYKFRNIDDDRTALLQDIRFHHDLDASGGFILLNYNLFTELTKNPFTASQRFTNINFGYPYNISLSVKIQLPANTTIDKLPEDKSIATTDASIVAYRTLKMESNQLIVNIAFRQTVTLAGHEKYSEIKTVYSQIIDMFNEPVVLKIAK